MTASRFAANSPARLRAAAGVLGAAGLAAISVLGAADAPSPGVTLTIDRSPVTQGAPAMASYADALEPARAAVVSVYSTRFARSRGTGFDDPLLRRFFGGGGRDSSEPERGLGSGVIVSSEGFVLTNNHVVAGADELLVRLTDDRELPAKLIGADPKTDLAVLRIESAEALPTIVVGDSDRLRVGDVVFALGNPLGVGQTATMGIVSATGRRGLGLIDNADGGRGYEDFIQTDAAINMGNSGGALVDARGRLVGINTAIYSTNRGNIGIGFSIPANIAQFVLRSLVASGRVVRGYLGVNPEALTVPRAKALQLKEAHGVLLREVFAGSPAERAGLKSNDVVLALNERAVATPDELRLMVSQLSPGTKVTLRYQRAGETLSADVVLAQLEEGAAIPPASDELITGIRVAELNAESRRRLKLDENVGGLLVVEVDRRSQYATTLPLDTVVLQINQRPVSDVRSAREALLPGRNIFLLSYGGYTRYLSIEVR